MSRFGDGPVRDQAHAVSITNRKVAYRGFRRVDLISYTEDEDTPPREIKREIMAAPNAVAIIVYDSQLERLVMVRQFRLAAQMGTGKGMCAEIVAGLIDEGETSAQAAHRELLEETGLVASRMEHQLAFLTSPGMTDEVIELYYAEVDASKLSSEAGAENEAERTFPFTLTLQQALEAVDTNGITNVIAMMGILHFNRNRNRLLNTTGEAE